MAVTRAGIRGVDNRPDFPALERELLAWWERDGIVEKYLSRNDIARAVLVSRWTDYGKQPDGCPSRLGPDLQGSIPALPDHAR